MHDDFLSSDKITSVICYSLQFLSMTHPRFCNAKIRSISAYDEREITCPYELSYLIYNIEIPAIINCCGNIPNPFKYSRI